LCTTIAKLESNSAPDLYFSTAAAACLVGEEKASGNNTKHNSFQNSSDSREQPAVVGHTTGTTHQM